MFNVSWGHLVHLCSIPVNQILVGCRMKWSAICYSRGGGGGGVGRGITVHNMGCFPHRVEYIEIV